jgi:hypothetical protein
VAADFAALCSRAVPFHGDLIRNIKSIHVSQALFDDLTDSAEEAATAMAAEAIGRIESDAPLITRPFDYGTVISYSFDAAKWQQTRFSDGTRYGVWYGSLDMKTTVYETVYHWHRFLMDAFANEDRVVTAERRLFEVRCDAILIDLRGKQREAPQLLSRKGYSFSQRLGRYLHSHDQSGLLASSARCEGVNAAVFQAARLSAVRDRARLTYGCNPREDRVVVEHKSGRTWFSIAPSALA